MTELEKALITIREECKKHTKCDECPLREQNVYDGEQCYMQNRAPQNYALYRDCNKYYRVFSD